VLAVGTGLLLIAAHGHAQERSSTDAMLVAVAARDVILYYVVDEISRTYRGMMIAIPEPEGKPFDSIGPEELARLLVALAGRVKLARFCRADTRTA